MEKRSQILKRILQFAKPHLKYLIASILFALLSVSLTLYTPVLIGKGIDLILEPGSVYFDRLAPLVLQLAAVAVAAALFQWLMSLCTNRITYRTVRDLRVAVFDKMEQLPLRKID